MITTKNQNRQTIKQTKTKTTEQRQAQKIRELAAYIKMLERSIELEQELTRYLGLSYT